MNKLRRYIARTAVFVMPIGTYIGLFWVPGPSYSKGNGDMAFGINWDASGGLFVTFALGAIIASIIVVAMIFIIGYFIKKNWNA